MASPPEVAGSLLEGRRFRIQRVEKPEDEPAPDERVVEVVVLDMNHGWPNLGTGSIQAAVASVARELEPALAVGDLSIRAVTFDVRKSHRLPEPPGGRFGIYLGTGGPGHIDPYQNDGKAAWTQGTLEDPAWEPRLHQLFTAIHADPHAALLAVCHTFGLMCYWCGVAQPHLRGPEKGGKSSGVRENVLTDDALRHPWFSRFAGSLPDGRHCKIADSRLFDLLPVPWPYPEEMIAIAHECHVPGGPPGEALTMVEFARDRGGVMPRIFAVNHHPEISGLRMQQALLAEKLARGEVSAAWYEERRVLLASLLDPQTAGLLRLTTRYTLLGPLRFHLHRLVRERCESLGVKTSVHENQVLSARAI